MIDSILLFSTGRRSRRSRDLVANSRCVISREDATQPISVQGTAIRIFDLDVLATFAEAYTNKYSWPIRIAEGEM